MSLRFATDPARSKPLHLIQTDGLPQAALPDPVRRWAESAGFRGRAGEALVFPEGEAIGGALVGMGDTQSRGRGRFHLAAAAAKLPPGDWRVASGLSAGEAEVEALGWLLESYRFDRYRAGGAEPRGLVAPDGVDAARLEAIANGVALTRDLVNTPTNDMGPDALEAACRELADAFGGGVETVSGEGLLTQNYPMIHAVGRAAAEMPRLIRLDWGDAGAPQVVLVGKGVCFDTGGLDIKPAANMRLMKKDMGGAATVLGLARIIMAQGLKLRLTVLIPAVENAISANAFRPGDILRARNGLSVEVGNTDAEGRLVLADALTRACEEKPALVLDFATLTGAARAALGPDLPALYSDDVALAAELAAMGDSVRDPMWRMPLWDGYEDELSSPIADLDNAPMPGFAGSITAALFLRRFVSAGQSWAHMDVFAHTPKPKPGRPFGGEMQAGRAAFAMLEARYG